MARRSAQVEGFLRTRALFTRALSNVKSVQYAICTQRDSQTFRRRKKKPRSQQTNAAWDCMRECVYVANAKLFAYTLSKLIKHS